jgi:hypothetical protein
MPTKTVIDYVVGELLRDGNKVYDPKLQLTVNEFTPDESPQPVRRWVVSHELTPMTAMVVDDGEYALRYVFDGIQHDHRVRVCSGRLWAATDKKK